MSKVDIAYLERRAETQLKLAEGDELTSVARAHYSMANAYLDQVARALPDNDNFEPRLRPHNWG
jgi:hypothetical protein